MPVLDAPVQDISQQDLHGVQFTPYDTDNSFRKGRAEISASIMTPDQESCNLTYTAWLATPTFTKSPILDCPTLSTSDNCQQPRLWLNSGVMVLYFSLFPAERGSYCCMLSNIVHLSHNHVQLHF